MRTRKGSSFAFCAALCAVCATAAAAVADLSAIKPVRGLVLTTNVRANLVSGAIGRIDNLDMEHLISLIDVGPDGLSYRITMTAPVNARAADELKKWRVTRNVRREDLEQSSRMTLLYATSDPPSYGGQTFTETSSKVLSAIKTKGETPFVIGIYGALRKGESPPAPPPPPAASGPAGGAGAPLMPDMGAIFSMLFDSSRYYYRGKLRRVESGDVPFSVLLNGVRTTVQAVHVAGTLSAGEDYEPAAVEFWWLDNPDYPLNLKWTVGRTASQVMRVDLPVELTAGGGDAGASMAAQLAGKSCRVELHGIYFNTGSAVLLEESEPMLKQVAALVKSSGDSRLTIEGHTDNIGSAQYNQTLSEQRAEAVMQALVTRYAVPPARLSAKGFGLTRPVETNNTFEGRAHNRRVELARSCATAQ